MRLSLGKGELGRYLRRAVRASCPVLGCEELGYSHEVIGGNGKVEHPSDARGSTMAGFAQVGGGLDPPKDLLDPLSSAQGQSVADMTYGAPVDGRLAPLAGLGHMAVDGDVRRNPAGTQRFDEADDVIGLIRAKRDPPLVRPVMIDQGERRRALGRSGGLRQSRRHHEAVAVFHQGHAP